MTDNDDLPTEELPDVQMGDAEEILLDLIDLISKAPNVPLSSTPRIDREEVVALLEDAIACLPQEVREARFMLKEKENFLTRSQREADEIIEAARTQAERLVQRTEVVRSSEARARQIIDEAESTARRLKSETEDFLDRRLGSVEILIDRLMKTIKHGRDRLSITGVQQANDQMTQDAPDMSGEFFDQEADRTRDTN
jgi:cell division septum initiation protein DivIVA